MVPGADSSVAVPDRPMHAPKNAGKHHATYINVWVKVWIVEIEKL